MNQHVKELWVNALRSGDYSQAKGALRNSQGYCCLGVLCDLYIQEDPHQRTHWKNAYPEVLNQAKYFLEGEGELLPSSVVKWAELINCDPIVEIDEEDASLSELNDEGKTFVEIAQLIENQL